MSEKIYVFDTTLRDGEQSPGCSMNLEEKLKMAALLERLNVDVIEAGFPIASDGDFEAVQAISARVRKPTIAGLARANRLDIERAWEAVKGARKARIHTFIATSDIHLEYKLRKSRAEVLGQVGEAVRIARDLCEEVEFSAEDATRSDVDYLAEVFTAAIEQGATIINVPDTVGYAVPQEYGPFIEELLSKISNREKAIFSCHCHDDLGLAVANSLAGIENGCRQVECTVNGIGERAGNASLEEIVMALRTKKDLLPYHTDRRDLSVQSHAQQSHRFLCSAEQSHSRPQRFCPRSWNSPGWGVEERPDLRNHDPPVCRYCEQYFGDGEAQWATRFK